MDAHEKEMRECQRIVKLDESDQLEQYTKLVNENPDFMFALVFKALLLKKLGRLDEAFESLDKELELETDKDTAWAYYEKALICYDLGKPQNAIDCLDEATKLNPKDADSHCTKGTILAQYHQILKQESKLKEAIACYDKAIEIDQNHKIALYNKGLSLSDMRKYDEAISCYDQAIKIDPNFSPVFDSKGSALLYSGKYKKAISSYKKAIELDPTNADFLQNCAKMYWLVEDAQKAMELLDAAHKLKPELRDYDNIKSMLQERLKFNRNIHNSCDKDHDD